MLTISVSSSSFRESVVFFVVSSHERVLSEALRLPIGRGLGCAEERTNELLVLLGVAVT